MKPKLCFLKICRKIYFPSCCGSVSRRKYFLFHFVHTLSRQTVIKVWFHKIYLCHQYLTVNNKIIQSQWLKCVGAAIAYCSILKKINSSVTLQVIHSIPFINSNIRIAVYITRRYISVFLIDKKLRLSILSLLWLGTYPSISFQIFVQKMVFERPDMFPFSNQFRELLQYSFSGTLSNNFSSTHFNM